MSARRISGTLHTFRPLLDPGWADDLRTELAWLSATLAQEHACTSRLNRLLSALSRLSGAAPVPSARGEFRVLDGAPGPGAADAPRPSGSLTVGAARAGALLERQLTLARTRAHSAALQALGSSRFHGVADAVAVLASELPLGPVAGAPAAEALAPAAEVAEHRLLDAVAALPLSRAGHPYNAEALVHGLATASAGEAQDAPWHQVRLLLRLHRYAQEVLCPNADPVLAAPGQVARPAPRRRRGGRRRRRRGPHPPDRSGHGVRAGGAARGPAARGGGGPFRLPGGVADHHRGIRAMRTRGRVLDAVHEDGLMGPGTGGEPWRQLMKAGF